MAETPLSYAVIRSPPQRLIMGFFGRQGGSSTDIYDSLNCGMGSDDDKALVQEKPGYCRT